MSLKLILRRLIVFFFFVSGWGKMQGSGKSVPVLQQAKLKVVDKNTCHNLNYPNTGVPVTEKMICAGYGPTDRRSACHGDSGGPFVCRERLGGPWFLQGAVSWGGWDCDAASGYTVFVRVAEFRQWIDQQLQE